MMQAVLTVGLVQFVPVDGAGLERAAKLPTAVEYPASTIMMSLAQASLPTSPDRLPKRTDDQSVGVVTSAKSVLIVDRTSGAALYEKNADEVRPIGSISKLMTALVFLETHPNLDGPGSVISEDYREGGRMYLAVNDPVTVRDLLRASLIGSDNTATISLVRISGLSESDFVANMNAKAAELGMTNSTFRDPTGLSAANVSTARDIVLLLSAVQNVPEIASTIVMSQVTITQASGRGVTIDSTDELLTSFINQPPFSMLGGKTGYLPEAGYCIGVGVRHEHAGDVFIVLLGSDNKYTRVQEVKGLADWVYRVFTW